MINQITVSVILSESTWKNVRFTTLLLKPFSDSKSVYFSIVSYKQKLHIAQFTFADREKKLQFLLNAFNHAYSPFILWMNELIN